MQDLQHIRAMNLGGFLDGKAQQPLPPAFVDHEPELYAFQKDCQSLMNKILDLFAIGLEVCLSHLYAISG